MHLIAFNFIFEGTVLHFLFGSLQTYAHRLNRIAAAICEYGKTTRVLQSLICLLHLTYFTSPDCSVTALAHLPWRFQSSSDIFRLAFLALMMFSTLSIARTKKYGDNVIKKSL